MEKKVPFSEKITKNPKNTDDDFSGKFVNQTKFNKKSPEYIFVELKTKFQDF